jgi:hypothetical protein
MSAADELVERLQAGVPDGHAQLQYLQYLCVSAAVGAHHALSFLFFFHCQLPCQGSTVYGCMRSQI